MDYKLRLIQSVAIAFVAVITTIGTFFMSSALVSIIAPFDSKSNVSVSDVAQVLATCYVAFAIFIWAGNGNHTQITKIKKKR
jgi:membrane protease YdiL (CAAX protease family)